MPLIESKIEYETGKNSHQEIKIEMRKYTPAYHSKFNEQVQRHLSVKQKKPDTLNVEFDIITYSGAVLKSNGDLIPAKIEDVRESVNKIKKLMDEIAELHRQPICRVLWGEESFKGILTFLKYRYTLFTKEGTPVCAKFEAVFKEWINVDSALQNDNTAQSPDRSKYRMVYENTRLCQMAYQEYDDPGSWRLIAEANGINDPLDLTSGMLLALPPDH